MKIEATIEMLGVRGIEIERRIQNLLAIRQSYQEVPSKIFTSHPLPVLEKLTQTSFAIKIGTIILETWITIGTKL